MLQKPLGQWEVEIYMYASEACLTPLFYTVYGLKLLGPLGPPLLRPRGLPGVVAPVTGATLSVGGGWVTVPSRAALERRRGSG